MKSILFISNSTFISGAEKSLEYVLTSLNKASFNMFLAIPYDSPLKETVGDLCTIFEAPLLFLRKQKSVPYAFKVIVSLIETSILLKRQIEVNNIHIIVANNTKSCLYGVLLKIFTGKKLIWFIRDNLENRFLCQILALFSTKIVCASHFIASQLKGNNKKKVIIPNFLPIKDTINTSFAEVQELPKDQIIITNIGQFLRWKNQMDALLAFEILLDKYTNICLVFIGNDNSDYHNAYLKELKDYVIKNNLSAKVLFLSFKKNIFPIINRTDILLHTAIDEPFGRVLIEAMALSKPIVGYNSGGVPEIIINEKTGYIIDINKKQVGLSEKLEILIASKEARIEMGNAGKMHFLANYSTDINAPLIEKLLIDA